MKPAGPATKEFFDHHFAHMSDRACWECFRDHFAANGCPLPEDAIRGTPLPLLMKFVAASMADGTLSVPARWLPFIERAFGYVQTRN